LQYKAASCSHRESLKRTADWHKQTVSEGKGHANSVALKKESQRNKKFNLSASMWRQMTISLLLGN